MDGRVIFSSLESQGLRTSTLWGLWSIHPDGTQLGAGRQRVSAGREPECVTTSRPSCPTGRSWPRSITTRRAAASAGSSSCRSLGPGASPRSGPAHHGDPRNPPLARRVARRRPAPDCAGCRSVRAASRSLTRFARTDEGPADFAEPGRALRTARRQGDASFGRAGQPPLDRLVARPGQWRLHRPRPGRRCRPLPHQGRQADRRARPRCC